ncbi:MAG: hypothetical protein JNM57_03520 [Cyclobacteriaceae bacterium]|nr:hypothetical protein [Cyclobacteriaceae bacterium]
MQVKFKSPVNPELTGIVQKRNRRLQAFFSSKNLDVRLHGDAQNPLMVLCGCVGLSAYVKNFDLILLNKPNQGDVVKTFKLTEIVQGTREEVIEWIKEYPQMPLFRIQYSKSDLWLCGFNFRDREQRLGRFPVFAREDFHLYKRKAYAEEIHTMLANDGYDAHVTDPDLKLVKSHIGEITFAPEPPEQNDHV